MIVFVTGGASSGKSGVAEDLCTQLGDHLVYLAAMRPFGEEGARRVRKHRALRAGKGFETIECYRGLQAVLSDAAFAQALDGSTALLECLGNVVANELFGAEEDAAESAVATTLSPNVAAARIEFDIVALAQRCEHLVVVGNEVGADGVAYERETRFYQQVLGALSCRVAAMSDQVIECTCGVPVSVRA